MRRCTLGVMAKRLPGDVPGVQRLRREFQRLGSAQVRQIRERAGRVERSKSPVRNLIEVIAELRALRSVLAGAEIPGVRNATGLDAEQILFAALRMPVLAAHARGEAGRVVPIARRLTDATRLFADVCRYVETDFDATDADTWMREDARRSADLINRLTAIEFMVDPRFRQLDEIRIARTGARLASLAPPPGGSFRAGLEQIVEAMNAEYGEFERALERHSVKPGEKRGGDPAKSDASHEATLLRAMTSAPARGSELCKRAGLKYNSHSKAALAALVKQRKCGLKRGRGGGYFV